jgi:hypothetical protein
VPLTSTHQNLQILKYKVVENYLLIDPEDLENQNNTNGD